MLDTGDIMIAIEDDDGSEDVNDFLKRIKELGDRRDREDEERNRRLEEQIVQGRKERQARREGQCPRCRSFLGQCLSAKAWKAPSWLGGASVDS